MYWKVWHYLYLAVVVSAKGMRAFLLVQGCLEEVVVQMVKVLAFLGLEVMA